MLNLNSCLKRRRPTWKLFYHMFTKDICGVAAGYSSFKSFP